ncbi:carboxymuconolactone decarboxylase family protein [Micromonospora purpureochromogenes]|uniref:carboxymuconolactone decarboxylase family protein n=1 Tax=Micromonospora purpureochromogenes TaxID=47872 RepID=UPI00363B1EFB
MAHIDLGVDERREPGIVGLLRYRPETGGPLMDLAEVLLRGPSSLSRGERELIAAYVSGRNGCDFCRESHSATAGAQLDDGPDLVDRVLADLSTAPVPEKLRALLRLADTVREDGRAVTGELVDAARAHGATDREIHDVVLIAAAFSMYNRYVDGLGAATPDDPRAYAMSAQRILAAGYRA